MEAQQNPYVVYGALVGAALAIITAVADLKMATDPYARPDPFTGTDAARMEARLQRQIDQCRSRLDSHLRDYHRNP